MGRVIPPAAVSGATRDELEDTSLTAQAGRRRVVRIGPLAGWAGRSALVVALAASAFTSVACGDQQDASGRSAPTVVVSVEPRAELAIDLPDFELVDQSGKKVSKRDLAGQVWIADFIFTTCPTICPRLTEKMAGLAARTRDVPQLRFVSFTVDPENDTPEVLTAFGKKYQADGARWSFLTGEPKHVEDVVLKGFKQALSRDSGGMIFHSERFVLVDKGGRVRGFYETEPAQLEALEKRARELIAASP